MRILKTSGLRPDKAVAAGAALAMIGDARAAPHLRRILADERVRKKTRAWAGLALVGLGDWESLGALRPLIEKEERPVPAVRHAARPERPARRAAGTRTLRVGTRVTEEQMAWVRSQPSGWLPSLESGIPEEQARAEIEQWWIDRRPQDELDEF